MSKVKKYWSRGEDTQKLARYRVSAYGTYRLSLARAEFQFPLSTLLYPECTNGRFRREFYYDYSPDVRIPAPRATGRCFNVYEADSPSPVSDTGGTYGVEYPERHLRIISKN